MRTAPTKIYVMGRIKNAAAALRRRDDGSGPSEMPDGVTPPSRHAAPSAVSLPTAVSLVPVYRSIQILATMGGQLQLEVVRGGRTIETPALALSPDVNLPASRFYKRTIVSLAATGRCYWRKFRHADGTVASYQVLDPLATRRRWDDARRRYVFDTIGTRGSRTEQLTLEADQVRHLKLLEIPGMDDGVGPIQACRASLAGAVDLRDYSANWFRDSGVPNGILKTDQQLTPTTAKDTREAFKKSVEEHDLGVLGYGMDYKPMFLDPADAQWLENQQFTVTEIARLFGIPASYLLAEVNGSSMTYSNLEQIDTQFLRTTLLGYLVEIEDALSADLPRGQRAEFRTDRLLRSDNFTRAKINKLYLDAKVLDPDEVRVSEGYDAKEAAVDA